MQTWQQTVLEIYNTHKSYQRVRGDAPVGRHKHREGWSMTDTAKLLGVSTSTVCEAVAIVVESEINPEIMKCKDLTKAREIVRKDRKQTLETNTKRFTQYDN